MDGLIEVLGSKLICLKYTIRVHIASPQPSSPGGGWVAHRPYLAHGSISFAPRYVFTFKNQLQKRGLLQIFMSNISKYHLKIRFPISL